MNVAPGSRLGPYEITSSLGAGGMGEVWRARDTRLDRDVAIKVLRSDIAHDPQLSLRLEREAKTISQLNDPHVCALYDVGDGFLVMELLDGETLADRLSRGPLPVDQVLRYGAEIAGALDRAHRRGIVHRDLKPGNVMLTKSGAKLLDFGLARPQAQMPAAFSGATAMATEAKPLTAEGTIVGTFQYMAPEQLEAREPDSRTDIFALGAVLYEMATARRAFDGKTKTSLIAAILDREPLPINELQPLTPAAFEFIVAKCLAKDPDERWQSVHDVKLQLEALANGRTDEQRVRPRAASRWMLGAAALAVAASLLFAAWSLQRARRAHGAKTQFTIDLPLPLMSYATGGMAVAPDGSAIVYTAGPDRQQFYMRRLDSDSVTPIAGSEFGSRPFFSPDGRWIGFLGPDGLRKVPSSGGASQLITVVDGGFLGAVWLPDDTIVYCTRRAVLRIGSRGDQKPSVLKDAQVAGVYRSPSAMPDGKGVLLEYADSATPKIQLLTISTGNMHDVTDGGTPIALTGDELLFERSGTLFVAQFDPRHGGLLGAPISIAENVMVVPPVNLAQVAATSSLLVYARGATAPRTLVSVDRAGSALALLSVPGGAEDPRLSPDGKRVAMTVRSATDTDIWQADVQRRSMTRVTFERGEDEAPAWTSDGKRITYAGERAPNARATGNTAASGSPRDAIRGLYWKPFDGSGEEETLLTSSHPHTGAWSHDGKTLFYTDYSPAFAGELWTYSRDDRQKRVLLRTTFSTRAPAISPNGKWVAYTSSESGRDEIYVRPAGGPGGVVQVSVDGGEEALWSRSGDEIFFRDGTKMRSAMVRLTGGNFDTEPPKLLFDAPYVRARRGGEPGYDVGADGRFIMLRNEPDPDASRLHAQTGWFDDVDALLRTAGR